MRRGKEPASDKASKPPQDEEEDGDFPRLATWYHITALGLMSSTAAGVAFWNYSYVGEQAAL